LSLRVDAGQSAEALIALNEAKNQFSSHINMLRAEHAQQIAEFEGKVEKLNALLKEQWDLREAQAAEVQKLEGELEAVKVSHADELSKLRASFSDIEGELKSEIARLSKHGEELNRSLGAASTECKRLELALEDHQQKLRLKHEDIVRTEASMEAERIHTTRLQTQLELTLKDLEATRENLASTEVSLNQSEKRVADLTTALNAAQLTISQLQSSKQELERAEEQLLAEVKGRDEELKERAETLARVQSELNTLKSSYKSQMRQIYSACAMMKEECRALRTCLAAARAGTLSSIAAARSEHAAQVEAFKATLLLRIEERDAMERAHRLAQQALSEDISAARAAKIELEQSVSRLQHDLADLDATLRVKEESIMAEKSGVGRLRSELQQRDERIAELTKSLEAELEHGAIMRKQLEREAADAAKASAAHKATVEQLQLEVERANDQARARLLELQSVAAELRRVQQSYAEEHQARETLQSELNLATTSIQQHKGEIQQKVEELRELRLKLEAAEAAQGKLRSDHVEELASLQRQSAAKELALRAEFSDQLSKHQVQHNEHLAKLQAEHNDQLAKIQAVHNDQVAKMQAQHNDQIAKLQAQHVAEIEQLRSTFYSEKASLQQQQSETLDSSKRQLIEEYKAREAAQLEQMKRLQEEHANQLTQIRDDYAARVNALRDEHALHIKNIQAEWAARLDAARKEHVQQLERLRELKNEAITRAHADKEHALSGLQEKFDAFKADAGRIASEAQEEIQRLTNTIEVLRNELKAERDQSREALESEKKKSESYITQRLADRDSEWRYKLSQQEQLFEKLQKEFELERSSLEQHADRIRAALQQRLDDARDRIVQLEEALAQQTKLRSESERELKNLSRTIDDCKAEVEKATEIKAEAEAQLARFTEEKRDLRAEIAANTKRIQQLELKLSDAELQAKIATNESKQSSDEIQRLQQIISALRQEKASLSVELQRLQSLASQHEAKLLSERAEHDAAIAMAVERARTAEEAMGALQTRVTEAERALRTAEHAARESERIAELAEAEKQRARQDEQTLIDQVRVLNAQLADERASAVRRQHEAEERLAQQQQQQRALEDQWRARLEQCNERSKQVEAQLADAEQVRIPALEAQIRALERANLELQQRLGLANTDVEALKSRIDSYSEDFRKWQQAERESQEVKHAKLQLQQELADVRKALSETQHQKAAAERELLVVRESLQEANDTIRRLQADSRQISEDIEKVRSERRETQTELHAVRRALSDCEDRLRAKAEDIDRMQKQHEAEVERLRAEERRANQRISSLETKIAAISQQREEAVRKNIELTRECERLQTFKAVNEAEIASAVEDRDAAHAKELAARAAEHSQLKGEVSRLTALADTLRAQLAAATAREAEAREKLLEKQKAILVIKADLQRSQEEHGHEMTAMRSQLEQALDISRAEVASLKERISQLTETKDKLKQALATAQQSLAEHEAETVRLRGQLSDAESTLHNERASWNVEKTTQRRLQHAAEARASELQEHVRRAENELGHLKEEVTRLQTERSEAKLAAERDKERVKQLENEFSLLRSIRTEETHQAAAQRDAWAAQVLELQAEIQRMRLSRESEEANQTFEQSKSFFTVTKTIREIEHRFHRLVALLAGALSLAPHVVSALCEVQPAQASNMNASIGSANPGALDFSALATPSRSPAASRFSSQSAGLSPPGPTTVGATSLNFASALAAVSQALTDLAQKGDVMIDQIRRDFDTERNELFKQIEAVRQQEQVNVNSVRADAQRMLQQSQDALSRCQEELAATQTKLRDATANISRLETQLEQARAEAQQAESMLKKVKREHEEELRRLQDALSSKTRFTEESAQDRVRSAELSAAQWERKYLEANKRADDLSHQLAAAESELKQLRETHDQTLAGLTQVTDRVKAYKQELARERKLRLDTETTAQLLERQLNALRDTIGSPNAATAAVSTSAASSTASHNLHISSAGSDKQLTQQYSVLQEKYQALKARLAEAEAQLSISREEALLAEELSNSAQLQAARAQEAKDEVDRLRRALREAYRQHAEDLKRKDAEMERLLLEQRHQLEYSFVLTSNGGLSPADISSSAPSGQATSTTPAGERVVGLRATPILVRRQTGSPSPTTR